MNVIISNKNQALLENLGIDVIKEMHGEFDVDEIISTFQNFFYQRMILDITAIKGFDNISNLQKLSISLDMSKLILLLDGTEDTSSPLFISNLVSMGIYNFAKNLQGIQYLYNTPNTYRDVAQFHQINSINQQNAAITQAQPQRNISNFAQNIVGAVSDAFSKDNNEPKEKPSGKFDGVRIIGVKNVTKQSGATTLIYMMVNELAKKYKVLGIEVDKTDFHYFKSKNLITSHTSDLEIIVKKNLDKDVILIDLNNSLVAEGVCQEIIYLIEPSIIKLQKLMTFNARAMMGLKNRKVVLNKCLLSKSDISNFEYESRVKVMYSIKPLNEREKNIQEIRDFLTKLGFNLK